MKIVKIIAAAILVSTSAIAHELTPTYPELRPAFVDNVLVTTMKMWNRRNDTDYYEIQVFDKDWNKIPFAATDKIMKIGYLEHKTFDVYIRKKDENSLEFICTISKQLKQDVMSTGVKSKICSRIK